MNARDWFTKARKENFAIGAFNVDNLEIFKAICIAGKNKKSPVMLEFSPGEVKEFGLANIVDLASNAKQEYGIPVLLNLDHSKTVEDCLAAVEVSTDGAGFDDVHFDGSELPFDENIDKIKKVVEAAKARKLFVEGEIDHLPGGSEVHEEDIDLEEIKKSYTKPEKALEFVKKTGIDIFAAVFGNVHGTFPNQPDLDFALLAKIREAVGEIFISLHGGSGIPAEQVREAIRIGGIVKVNVNTEIRAAFHDALTEKMQEDSENIAYYKMTPEIIGAVAAVVESKIDVFGSGGKA